MFHKDIKFLVLNTVCFNLKIIEYTVYITIEGTFFVF